MNKTLLYAILLLIICFLLYAGYNAIEYYEKNEDLGWRKEARINPYLAAQLYIEAKNQNAFSADSFKDLAPLNSIGTLFISDSGHVISGNQLRQLTDWIQGGGHLIVAPKTSYSTSEESPDRLLDFFGVSSYDKTEVYDDEQRSEDCNHCAGEEVDVEKSFAKRLRELSPENEHSDDNITPKKALSHAEKIAEFEKNINKSDLTQLAFDSVPSPLPILFSTDTRIWHPSLDSDDTEQRDVKVVYWQGDKYGAHFMQLNYGYGLVSILSSPAIFTSNEIDKFEHAYFWDILTDHDRSVAILYGSNMPSLWQLLKAYASEIIVNSFLLLFIWVIYHLFRFGPVKQRNADLRRSMLENINASAKFLWRSQYYRELLDAVQADLVRLAKRNIDGFAQAHSRQRLKLLENKTGIAHREIASCMGPPNSHERSFSSPQGMKKIHGKNMSEDTFLRSIKLLQTIRKKL